MSQQIPAFRFEPPTPFVKQILIGGVVLYILENIIMQWMGVPLQTWIAWSPEATFSAPWTVVTHFLFIYNNPLGFLFEMLALYFFLPVILDSYGKKGLNRLLLWIVIITTVLGIVGVVTGAVPKSSPPAFGIRAITIALVAIFGLKNPFATIYLLVFPIQASWVAWGSGLFALLSFFNGRSLESLIVVAGWITGYLFVSNHGHIKPQKIWSKYVNKYKNERRYRKLKAYDGGKSDPYEH